MIKHVIDSPKQSEEDQQTELHWRLITDNGDLRFQVRGLDTVKDGWYYVVTVYPDGRATGGARLPKELGLDLNAAGELIIG